MGGNLLTCDLLLFVTATFLLGMYFLPVAVVLSGGVKQVTTLPGILPLREHYLALYMGYMWDRVYHIPFPC